LYRTPQEQAGLVADKAANRRGQYQGLPVANPYESAHNYALAGDFAGYKPEYRSRLGEIVKGIPGMVYGGDFNDPLHVQLGRNHGQLKSLAYDESGKFNREFKLPEGFLSGDQATAYVAPQGGPAVAQEAFKNVRAEGKPEEPKSGLGAVKESLGDAGNFYSRNREHIIPAIAGLGSMLASNRPNLGQALGEGLVGYSTSAADMMKRQADVENTRQATASMENADIVKSQTNIGGIPGYWLKNRKWVTHEEYDALGRPPVLGDRISEDSPEYKAAMAKVDAIKGGQRPAAGQPTGETAAGLGAAPAPVSQHLDDKSAEAIKADRSTFYKGETARAPALEQSKKYTTFTAANAANAIENQRDVNTLVTQIIAAGGQTGLGSAGGPTYPARMAGLETLNDVANWFRKDKNAPSNTVSDAPNIANEIGKITTRLAGRPVGSDEQTLGQFRASKDAIASGRFTRETGAELAADLMVKNRLGVDQGEHLNEYSNRANGVVSGAQGDFNRVYDVSRQEAEKKALTQLILKYPEKFNDFVSGKQSPAEITKIFQEVDPRLRNMGRYFGGVK
jgi:hypothetical protein